MPVLTGVRIACVNDLPELREGQRMPERRWVAGVVPYLRRLLRVAQLAVGLHDHAAVDEEVDDSDAGERHLHPEWNARGGQRETEHRFDARHAARLELRPQPLKLLRDCFEEHLEVAGRHQVLVEGAVEGGDREPLRLAAHDVDECVHARDRMHGTPLDAGDRPPVQLAAVTVLFVERSEPGARAAQP